MTVKTLLKTVTVPSEGECLGSVIFLHGSGGEDARELVRSCLGADLSFQHLQIHYPNAPLKPYTANGGAKQGIWYDRLKRDPKSPEQQESINLMAEVLNAFIKEEIRSGIVAKKIFLGGFSMGGGMSLHVGLRYRTDLAGIFGLSSFLSEKSCVYEAMEGKTSFRYPRVFMAHGDADEDVYLEWGEATRHALEGFGVHPTKFRMEGANHVVTKEEIIALKDWILNVWEEENLGGKK